LPLSPLLVPLAAGDGGDAGDPGEQAIKATSQTNAACALIIASPRSSLSSLEVRPEPLSGN
jgi:hypothetical protein